jgi:hypothetical protein
MFGFFSSDFAIAFFSIENNRQNNETDTQQDAGLPDGLFQTKNPNLGKFWRALKWKILVPRYILWPFEIYYHHLVYYI